MPVIPQEALMEVPSGFDHRLTEGITIKIIDTSNSIFYHYITVTTPNFKDLL